MNASTLLLLGPFVDRLGWALLHFIWQGLLIAAILSILLRVLRNRSANARYLSAYAGLMLMAVCVPITAWPGPSQISETESQTLQNSAPALESHELAQYEQIDPGLTPLPERAILPAAETRSSDILRESPHEARSGDLKTRLSTAHLGELRKGLANLLHPALPWMVGGWLIGALAISIWHLGGFAQMIRLRRSGTGQASKSVEHVFQLLIRNLRIRQRVRILVSTLAKAPMVIGWLRPIILLPVSVLSEMSPAQLEMILAHELAHVRRYDYLLNLLQIAVETVLFYHPGVWWISRRIRDEREICCDQWVVAALGNRLLYANALMRVAELRLYSTHAVSMAANIAADGGSFESRIRRVLGLPARVDHSMRPWLGGMMAIIVLAAVMAGGLSGASGEPSKDASNLAVAESDTTPPKQEETTIDNTSTEHNGVITCKLIAEQGLVATNCHLPFNPNLSKDKIKEYNVIYATLSEKPLTDLKAEPKYRSKIPLYGEIELGVGPDNRFAVVVDEVDGEMPQIYIDRDRDRDLTNERVDNWTDLVQEAMFMKKREIAEVLLRVPYPKAAVPYWLFIYRSMEVRRDALGYTSNVHRKGEIQLDGQKYKIALQDENFDGRFDVSADSIIIDRNQDGKLEEDKKSAEYYMVNQPFNVHGKDWKVASVTPDGLSVSMRPSAEKAEIRPYLLPGTKLSDFSAPLLDGKIFNLKEEANKTKYVLLQLCYTGGFIFNHDYFLTLRKLHAQYKRDDLQIVVIDTNTNQKIAKLIIEKYQLDYPMVYAGDKAVRAKIDSSLRPAGTTIYLVDKDLNIVDKDLRGESLVNRLKQLLGPGDEEAAARIDKIEDPDPLAVIPDSIPKPRINAKGFSMAILPRPNAWRMHPGSESIFAVALHLPYVYALGRNGNVFIAKITEGSDGVKKVDTVGEIESAGNGSDLCTVGETLFFSHNSGIAAYSLADPAKPELIQVVKSGNFYSRRSQRIIGYKDNVFLLGPEHILTFDIDQPSALRFLSASPASVGWSGCVIDKYLYTGGIAVYDLDNPREPKEVGSGRVNHLVYHLLPVDSKRLVAVGGPARSTSVTLYSLADPVKPVPLGESLVIPNTEGSGRCSATVSAAGRKFLVINGMIYAIGEKDLKPYGDFADGRNADGFPYHAAVQDNVVAISTDTFVALLTIDPTKIESP